MTTTPRPAWDYADPLVGAAIGVFILPRAWRLDLDEVRTELAAIPGVSDVHDVHVWTLTSDMDVATAHLVTSVGTDAHPILDRARIVLEGYGVTHATVQVEPDTHEGCAELTW